MPSRCSVTGCDSNYESSLKGKQKGPGISVFKFPKNEERKQSWIRAIPRKDLLSTDSSVVCQLHFQPDDIILYDKQLLSDESFKQQPLRRPRLKDTAIPSIFPNLPGYLTKPPKDSQFNIIYIFQHLSKQLRKE